MARVVYVYDDVALTSAGAVVSAMSSEDASFPKNNAIQPDRRRIARTLVGPGNPVTIDIDLGAAKPISGFGVMNLNSDAAVGARPAVTVASGASFGGATVRYTIAAGTWDTSTNLVDVFAAAATFTDRFWRISVATATRFSVGKIILGTGIDLGFLYSGADVDIVTPTTRLVGVNGFPIDVRTGDPHRVYAYKYRASDAPTRAVIERLARQVAPFGLLDSLGNSAHVVLGDPKKNRFTHVFGDIWDAEIAMEELI